MTDYAKHIEDLEALRTAMTPGSRQYEAVTAAIELMRSASPKDAEAERGHCEAVAGELLDTDIAGRWIGRRAHAATAFIAERAAARAEGYTRIDAMQTELAAAKAEIERLTAELQQTKAALAAANILLSGAFA